MWKMKYPITIPITGGNLGMMDMNLGVGLQFQQGVSEI